MSLSVYSAGEDTEPKGFLDFVNDYFDTPEVTEPGQEEVEELPYAELEPGATLFAITPEEINNGALKINFNVTGTSTTGTENTIVTTGWNYTSSDMSYQYPGNTVVREPRITASQTFNAVMETIGTTSAIGETGDSLSFYISNLFMMYDVRIWDNNFSTYEDYTYYFNGEYTSLFVYYKDISGIYSRYEVKDLKYTTASNGRFSVMFNTNILPYDIYGIKLELKFNAADSFDIPANYFKASDNDGSERFDYTPSLTAGNKNGILDISEIDTTTGFLDGILTGVRNIWDAIVNLPSNIVNGLGNILKSLFVPSEEELSNWMNTFDSFFADHFGFVYQGASVVVETFQVLYDSANDVSDTITIPEFTYNFDGAEFNFGGYVVDVIPEGFESVVDVLKFIVNIVMSLAFLNVSLKYFDKFMHR